LIAEAVALLLFGGWMINTLVDFTRNIFQRIPTLFL
jgi:flagellar biosynthetic protein FliQ